jgi:predicted GIY-YIG superfamily endonuclease
MIDLKHFVRAAADPILQECLRIFDKVDITTEEAERFADAVVNNATHYASFADVPEGAIRILPKRNSVNAAVKQAIESKRGDPNIKLFEFPAMDEVDSGVGSWRETVDRTVIRKLNNEVYEEENLVVYVGAVVRLTYNENNARVKFSQGQAAKVISVNPDNMSIRVQLAPPGVTDYDHFAPDWPEVVLQQRYSQPVVVGTRLTKARRKQFPICHLVASTVHRVQGATLRNVVTKLTLDDPDYTLWENNMLVVLISRTERLKDLGFVGDRSTTRKALVAAAMIRSPYKRHVNERLRALDIMTDEPRRIITNEFHPYCPRQVIVPDTDGGFVYLLVSGKEHNVTYIGQTCNLVRRIREHNNGYGSVITNNVKLMPWLLLAFISGFPETGSDLERQRHREEFESQWHNSIYSHYSAMDVLNRGRELVAQYNRGKASEHHIHLTECGQIRSVSVEDDLLLQAEALISADE